jgi:hypothetical protein
LINEKKQAREREEEGKSFSSVFYLIQLAFSFADAVCTLAKATTKKC